MSSENLGVTETRGKKIEAARAPIQAAWRANVQAHGCVGPQDDGMPSLNNTCAALDPALWFFGE